MFGKGKVMEKKLLVLITLVLIIGMSNTPVTKAKNLINEEVSVPPFSFMSYYFNIETDYLKIDLSINTFLTDISVYVMDDYNYNRWTQGESAQTYFQRHELLDGDYEIGLGVADVYYIVLDNTDGLFSSRVKIVVSVPSPAETIGIIVGALIGVGLFVFVLIKVTSNKTQHTQHPIVKTPNSSFIITPPIEKTVKYCENCGSRLELDTIFCHNCGVEQ